MMQSDNTSTCSVFPVSPTMVLHMVASSTTTTPSVILRERRFRKESRSSFAVKDLDTKKPPKIVPFVLYKHHQTFATTTTAPAARAERAVRRGPSDSRGRQTAAPRLRSRTRAACRVRAPRQIRDHTSALPHLPLRAIFPVRQIVRLDRADH